MRQDRNIAENRAENRAEMRPIAPAASMAVEGTGESAVGAATVSAAEGATPGERTMPARDKRAVLYLAAFVFDILAIMMGYFLALEVRDERWLEAAGQSILVLALPVFVMIALAREVHSVETLESRLLGVQRALGSLGATALVLMGLGFIVNAEDISGSASRSRSARRRCSW